MTQAETPTTYGAGDESPLPTRTPGRAQIIAAIHAYADWLAEHPEIPAPRRINASHHVHDGSLSERIDHVDRFAYAQEVEARRTENTVFALLPVMDSAAHGVDIWHTVATHTERPL